ncbi:FecR family protein 9 [Achromobacter xylosoxidans A8]|uniref:FecR family protein 9 n=1 Tax=Achromobacter xylosoxidans (strain A8) TaxID=762376 RepID=E3HNJ6_ACHXA|nr:FecR domain-containing protein [Achromobacter xylosoxidans]ADP15861.1 FecR family protein 9 [Achromobacter xylosoxidans A8]
MPISPADPSLTAFPQLNGPPLPASVSLRAVEWLVALQAADASDSTHAACQRWRAEHPDHERAWRHIESFGQQLRGLNTPLVRGTLTHEDRNGRTRRRAIKTLALALFAGGGAWLARDSLWRGWQDWQSDHHTDAGQRLGVTLADASRIDLDTASAIDVRFDSAQRLVRLLRGRILVTTAPDPASPIGRPFLVETAQGRVRALGTRYSVRQFPDRSHVAVFEGTVEIRPDLHTNAPRLIHASEQASFTRDAVDQPRPAEPRDASWSVGMLVAQDMPLSDFIEELARYVPGRLACAPDASHLKVSGIYPLDNADRVLDMLRRTHPVEVDRMTRYWITVRLRGA